MYNVYVNEQLIKSYPHKIQAGKNKKTQNLPLPNKIGD